jgi:2-hydroxy-3-oxopropionate reductase
MRMAGLRSHPPMSWMHATEDLSGTTLVEVNMNDKPVVGFIGLGIMGEPMARHVLAAGFPLVVHNRSRGKVDALVAAGARDGSSPAGVARLAEIILMCLPDSPDVEKVMMAPDGVFAGISAGKVVVDMSTISPVVARRLAMRARELGVEFLDAPISGGETGAQQGTLSIMVGGSQQAFERVMPVFQVMGKTIMRMGDSGAGQVTKACNQMMVAVLAAGVSEAMVFATKAGVDPALVRQVLLGGAGYSRFLENSAPHMIQHSFQPGFKLKLHNKDLNIVLSAAKEFGVPVPTTALVQQLYAALMAAGKGEMDFTVLVTLFEQMASAEVKGPSIATNVTKGE